MWDTIRVDHGREFYLSLYMQQKNEDKRYNTTRSAYIQSESKHVSINDMQGKVWTYGQQRNQPSETG